MCSEDNGKLVRNVEVAAHSSKVSDDTREKTWYRGYLREGGRGVEEVWGLAGRTTAQPLRRCSKADRGKDSTR